MGKVEKRCEPKTGPSQAPQWEALARSEEGEYLEYLTDERRRQGLQGQAWRREV